MYKVLVPKERTKARSDHSNDNRHPLPRTSSEVKIKCLRSIASTVTVTLHPRLNPDQNHPPSSQYSTCKGGKSPDTFPLHGEEIPRHAFKEEASGIIHNSPKKIDSNKTESKRYWREV